MFAPWFERWSFLCSSFYIIITIIIKIIVIIITLVPYSRSEISTLISWSQGHSEWKMATGCQMCFHEVRWSVPQTGHVFWISVESTSWTPGTTSLDSKTSLRSSRAKQGFPWVGVHQSLGKFVWCVGCLVVSSTSHHHIMENNLGRLPNPPFFQGMLDLEKDYCQSLLFNPWVA